MNGRHSCSSSSSSSELLGKIMERRGQAGEPGKSRRISLPFLSFAAAAASAAVRSKWLVRACVRACVRVRILYWPLFAWEQQSQSLYI